MIGPFENENRGARERGTVAALKEAGINVVQLSSPPPANGRPIPNLAIPVITAALLNNPDVKMVGYPGGQMLGNVADLHAGGRQEAGRDLQLRLRHQPADRRGLQGRLGAADRRPAAVPAGLSADPQPLPAGRARAWRRSMSTPAPASSRPQNYEIVAELAKQALR